MQMLTRTWAQDAVFYHIYPLGFCGAPRVNGDDEPIVPRLEKIHSWLDHLRDLGVTAVYLGPVFQSESHGYDPVDYFTVDRRLGTAETLFGLRSALNERGMRLVLDGVFNHVGREFEPFRDVREKKRESRYLNWFSGLDFSRSSPYGDPFSYDCWEGHSNLVKLNVRDGEVREYLFNAVGTWIDMYGIDGLRLDVAYCLDPGFLQELSRFCRNKRPDFWLMGEMIHGDYRNLITAGGLDSVTNYECGKGLWSCHKDSNYFEIAWSLDRQFGESGIYRGLPLYTFVDNHDVNRAADMLTEPAHLYPLYCLLFTMPGIPSIYYGSEWGVRGMRSAHDDAALRPCLDLESASSGPGAQDLARAIGRFALIRNQTAALREGDYRKLHVGAEQFAFMRKTGTGAAVVALNSSSSASSLELDTGLPHGTVLIDRLNGDERYVVSCGKLRIPTIHPCWAVILATL